MKIDEKLQITLKYSPRYLILRLNVRHECPELGVIAQPLGTRMAREVRALAIVTLYVGNLPWSTTDQDLVDWVSPHARVKSTRIIVDRESGRSRGFGFVEVEQEDAAKAIEALNGTLLGGRAVTVNEAQARPR